MSQLRRRNLSGKGMVYDSRVEYLLGNTGTWIDTGVCPDTNNAQVYADFAITQQSSGTYIQDQAVFGNYTVRDHYGKQKGWAFYHQYGSGEWGSCGPNEFGKKLITPSIGTRYEVFSGPNHNNYIKLYGSDTVLAEGSATIYSSFSPGNICIFGKGLGDEFFTNGRLNMSSYAKVYHLTITVQDTLVRDFIPVRIGAIGYMYDQVTGQLFENSGPDAFTLGPDI